MNGVRVLVIEHEAQCPPAWFGDWLVEAGAELDVRRPYLADVLPEDLTDHDALVVLGGSMGADDDKQFPWLSQVKQLVRGAAGTPTLGICLGHQLAAVALGGESAPNPRGQQVGVLPVGWSDAVRDDELFAPLIGARIAAQWNNDVVTRLPDGAVVLAETAHGEVQAARFGPRLWGVQWHPEVGAGVIGSWAEHDREGFASRGDDIDAYVDQVAAAEAELYATWRGLADRFVAIVTRPRQLGPGVAAW